MRCRCRGPRRRVAASGCPARRRQPPFLNVQRVEEVHGRNLRCRANYILASRIQADRAAPSAIGELERDLIRERVVAGVRRAQAAGKHCGRPRVDLDLRPALALLREGRSLKEVSAILKLSRATLRRRLRETGAWPPPGGEQDEAA